MAISLSGSGQYLTQGTAIVSALPLTLACWFNPTSTAATGTLLSISNNSTENSYFIMVMIAGGVLRAQQSTGGTAVNAVTATSMTANNWYHCAAVFTSATSRTVYLNGVAVSNARTNFQGSGTALNVCNGTIAYEAVWNVALSSTDIANLYNSGAGSDPRLIQGGSIVSFSLLQSGPPFADQGNSSTWTTTGSPLVAADPFSVSGGGGPVADVRFGFSTHFNQGWPTSLLPLIAATGVGYIRDNLTTNGANGWEPSTGTFQVSPTDKVWCNLAHSNGLKVVGIMGGNNLYPTNQFYDPTLMGNRAAFIAQSGLVDVIEVLNEPNNAYQAYEVSISRNWLTDLPILTTACTNAVNAVSSTVQVIGLGAQGSEIWGMYPSTTVDGIVYHPYDTGNSKAAVDVPDTCYEQPSGVNATSSLVYVPWISICRGQTTLPLWETEWGVQQPDVLGAFTEDNQADYLVRRLLTAAGLAVEHTFIYAFKDNSNPGVNQDCFGVYNFAGTTAKASYAAVTNTISALSGVIGTPSSIVTISSVANGDTADVKAYLYQGPGKTVASLWFGNFSPSAPPAASTTNIHFAVASVNNAIVTNPIAGTSVPLSTYTNALSGGQLTITGIPISDHPLLIVLNTDTSVTPASSSKASVTARTNLISGPPFFIQRAINHVTAAGAITCPVNTATTGTGNLLVVCIGSLAAGTIISSLPKEIPAIQAYLKPSFIIRSQKMTVSF